MDMMVLFQLIVSCLCICMNNIRKCYGYDNKLTISNQQCDYSLQYLTKDQTTLIEWYGQEFSTWHHQCTIWFYVTNYGEFLSTFQVCFKVKKQYFANCDITLSYIRKDMFDYADDYRCHDTIPDVWCTGKGDDSHTAKLKIVAKERSNSKFFIEVFVKEDDSVKIALAIAGAVVVVAGVALTIGIICCCRKCGKHEKPNEGVVVRSHDDLRNTRFEGETLVGYPTQQTEMVPAGRGRYRPKNVTVQHVMPRGTQPQVYSSQQPFAMPQQQFTTTTTSNSPNNKIPEQHPPASAPPPAYEACTK